MSKKHEKNRIRILINRSLLSNLQKYYVCNDIKKQRAYLKIETEMKNFNVLCITDCQKQF